MDAVFIEFEKRKTGARVPEPRGAWKGRYGRSVDGRGRMTSSERLSKRKAAGGKQGCTRIGMEGRRKVL